MKACRVSHALCRHAEVRPCFAGMISCCAVLSATKARRARVSRSAGVAVQFAHTHVLCPRFHFFFLWQTPSTAQVRRRHRRGFQTVQWREEDLRQEGWRPLGTYQDASDPEHGEASEGAGRNSLFTVFCCQRHPGSVGIEISICSLVYPVVRQPFT